MSDEDAFYLSIGEAALLTRDIMIDYSHVNKYRRWILVCDAEKVAYDMTITQSGINEEGVVRFSLGGQWNQFVRDHDLEAGSKITFYQAYDSKVQDDYFYVIKFSKPDGENAPAQGQVGPSAHAQAQLGPGSRYISPIFILLEKDLREIEAGATPILHLTVEEAGKLARNCPFAKTPSACQEHAYLQPLYVKVLLVFDSRNRQYNIELRNYSIGEGNLGCELSREGWDKFVQDNRLRAEDHVTIYYMYDGDISSNDYLFVFQYVRKPAHVQGGCKLVILGKRR